MRTRLNLYIFSRILKNNIHPGKLHCCCCCCFVFFLSLFCFCFCFFFHQISQSQNDQTSIICLLISVTATFSLKIVVEWRRSSFDLTTSLRLTFWHITKKREQILKRGLPIRAKPRRSLWLKFLTFASAGNTDNGSFGRTSCIQRKENTAIHGRITKLSLYFISKY